MSRKPCAACGDKFTQRRNIPDQQFCSKSECQRERRRRWQRDKLKQDPDYRVNQAAAQRRWRERHPDYWRDYRRTHPEYTEHNREQQRKRNQRRGLTATGPSPLPIAKMDVYDEINPVASGTYRMIPEAGTGIAKMDAYLVKIQVLSDSYSDKGVIAKR